MKQPSKNRIRMFWARTKKEGSCIEWTGHKNPKGYGVTWLLAKQQLAHRAAWYIKFGEYPKLTLDHLCRNRACVNVEHLEDVTQKVNNLRGVSPCAVHARKTHCPQGHPYSGDNLRMYRNHRYCRACTKINGPYYRKKYRLERIEAQKGVKK